jgi:hypothetical protein
MPSNVSLPDCYSQKGIADFLRRYQCVFPFNRPVMVRDGSMDVIQQGIEFGDFKAFVRGFSLFGIPKCRSA